MPDRLFELLRQAGYQSMFPRTDYEPPDLYVYADDQLKRLGPLSSFLKNGASPLPIKRSKLPNIQVVETTQKSLSAATKFLDNVFRSLGIKGGPGLSFSSSGKNGFLFKVTDVTADETAPVEIAKRLDQIDRNLVLAAGAEIDQLHVAYSYAYAESLVMTDVDNSEITAEATGVEIENLVTVNAKGKRALMTGEALVFKSKNAERAAFAYKAVQLTEKDGNIRLRLGTTDQFVTIPMMVGGVRGLTGPSTTTGATRPRSIRIPVNKAWMPCPEKVLMVTEHSTT